MFGFSHIGSPECIVIAVFCRFSHNLKGSINIFKSRSNIQKVPQGGGGSFSSEVQVTGITSRLLKYIPGDNVYL